MRKILFGAAYYPEYMPYERMDEDMRMMKKAHINTIRVAESTWSTLEPSEGKFDFTWIDRILGAAARNELQVIIGTPTYAIPAWLVRKDPGVMIETKDGKQVYGHRQIFDITSETYLQACEKVIRALLNHTASHPNVIGFQIDNETKHFGVSSPKAQSLFKEYLKQNFKTTDELNRRFTLAYWSNSIADWDDLPDMNGCINAGLACEFERFQRKLASDFLAWQAQLVREYKREDQFITHNLDFEWKKFGADISQDGYSYGVQPGISHYEVSSCLTLAGTDIYHPTQDESTGRETAFCGDSIRSLKYANYLVLETQAQAFKEWTPYPGQLFLDVMGNLASGAMGVMYWNWHSIHNSFETYWKGILSHDLGENPAYEEICRIGETLERIGADHLCVEKKNDTALVIDHHCLSALNWHPTNRDLSYNDVVRWMYDSLYEMNIECDVVDINALETERYSYIILPELYSASEKSIAKLKAFVNNGGTLLASFRSFFCDEHLQVYHDLQPHGMTECFGVSYSQFTAPGKVGIRDGKLQYFMELLTPSTAQVLSKYEHRYWGKYAAVTQNRYGRGRAFYIGCYTDKEYLKNLYRKVWQTGGHGSDTRTAERASWPVIIREGRNRFGRRVAYVLNYSEEDAMTACPFPKCRDLITGTEYRKEERLRLKDWGGLVLEEE